MFIPRWAIHNKSREMATLAQRSHAGGGLGTRICFLAASGRFRAGSGGYSTDMYIGTSIFLIALGAILAFAVNATVAGFEIQTAGVILMVVGVIGLVISFALMTVWSDRRRRADVVERDRMVERDRPVQP